MSRVENRSLKVGVIGWGNIAGGVIDSFGKGKFAKAGIELSLVAVRDPSKFRDIALPDSARQTADANLLIADPNIDIVVELINDTNKAREYIHNGFEAGKHWVTGSKDLLGKDLPDLFDLAREREVSLNFEASVCGAIPIIGLLREYYQIQEITSIRGIMNGTTNYILTRMGEEMDFEPALKQAQGLGIAESNHILDTGGFDTRSKLAIVASMASGMHIKPDSIPCRGITEVTKADIEFARELGVEKGGKGYAIKLLASAERHDGSWILQVAPTLISKDDPIASVDERLNAVTVESDFSEAITYTGPGASRYPTAGAVNADILHAAQHIRYHIPDFLPELKREASIAKPEDILNRAYIRVVLLDRNRTIGRIGNLLADANLGIKSILQREDQYDVNGKPFTQDIITLHEAKQSDIQAGLDILARSRKVRGKPFYMSFAH